MNRLGVPAQVDTFIVNSVNTCNSRHAVFIWFILSKMISSNGKFYRSFSIPNVYGPFKRADRKGFCIRMSF